MKKIFVTLLVAIATVAGAYAQEKGSMAVGLNLGVAPCLESGASWTPFGLGVKYQYNVSNPVRLEADIEYWFKNKGVDDFDIAVNAHYLFRVADRFNVYPILGIGYAHLSSTYGGGCDRFLFNVGVGGEYAFTDHISAGLEIKYQYLKNFQRLPISIGATYRF